MQNIRKDLYEIRVDNYGKVWYKLFDEPIEYMPLMELRENLTTFQCCNDSAYNYRHDEAYKYYQDHIEEVRIESNIRFNKIIGEAMVDAYEYWKKIDRREGCADERYKLLTFNLDCGYAEMQYFLSAYNLVGKIKQIKDPIESIKIFKNAHLLFWDIFEDDKERDFETKLTIVDNVFSNGWDEFVDIEDLKNKG